MDDHHPHQWRYPPIPPPQPNICPVCSISHFPFCPPYPPPPHLYNQNPMFPPPPPTPPPKPHYAGVDPYHANSYRSNSVPNDAWHRNPTVDYGEGYAQPMYDYSYYSNKSGNGYVCEFERSYKRARVDECGSSAFEHENNHNLMRALSEDERRLKLIRDHGGADNGGSNVYSPFQPNGSNCEQPSQLQNPAYGIHGDGNVRYSRDSMLPTKGNQYSDVNNWQDHQPPQPYGMVNYGALDSNENIVFNSQPPPPPPLPASPPPPPPPLEPPGWPSSEFKPYSSPPRTSFSLFPVPIDSAATNPYLNNKPLSHASTDFVSEECQMLSRHYFGESQPFHRKQLSPEKPTIVNAAHLFKQPYRATRPDHIVIILRGLPGSGKSYLAKMMRDLEVESGGTAPRIHSMDDYFMTEVEKKVEEGDASKSSSSIRGKKPTVKKVMEYCYEPEMEEAYRDSMLKAFKKTLEEGIFTLVIVDDRNLRVADFAQFWATAKRSGYEVYISEATYKDPAGCAARNVHGFSLDEIQNMAGLWEEAPSLYLQLDMKSLFHGDDLKENGIQEVDMDAEDGDSSNDASGQLERKPEKTIAPPTEDDAHNDGKQWDIEEDHPTEGVKELGKSKWSGDLDGDDTKGSESDKGKLNALSGLIQAYGKRGKSVRWSDQVGNTGFSIAAAKKANTMSLVIGPGSGYNLKSNPLSEEESPTTTKSSGKARKQNIFQERLRAEQESFKAVFDRRRQRVGLDLEEEY